MPSAARSVNAKRPSAKKLSAGLLKKFDVPKGSWRESGKIKKLLELLAEYKANGDRVLVFSKFSKVIEIIAYVLHDEGIDHSVLTGSSAVGDRQREIDRFQSDEDIPAFLLTTGAGGTGINLTAANKVVIFGRCLRLRYSKNDTDCGLH